MNIRQLTMGLLSVAFLFSCSGEKKPDNTDDEKQEEVKEEETTTSTAKTFKVVVTENTEKKGFPALQSFVLGRKNNKWLLFGGRTNGMHDFGGDNYEEKSFPIQDFNDSIYVYNFKKDKSVAVSADLITGAGKHMFKATNLQHYQDGNNLYISGGYGENDEVVATKKLERWNTHPYMAKIDVKAMIKAVESKDPSKTINDAIVYVKSDVVRATGGELYKMGDYFYLAGGHVYQGIFSIDKNDTVSHSQVYLDAVHRFKVTETDGALAISDVTKITDGFRDDSTQFRRRDLPVTPALRLNGDKLEESITMYAGVFTSPTNKIAGLTGTSNWIWPIYIYQDGTYDIDQTYTQTTNVYSAPSFVTYDSDSKTLNTTIIGGIDNGNQQQFGRSVLTINHPLAASSTCTGTAQDSMSTTNRYGAEAIMVLEDKNRVKGIDLDVFDISKMKSGDEMTIGRFFGGIEAEKTNPGGFGSGLSKASGKMFDVKIVLN